MTTNVFSVESSMNKIDFGFLILDLGSWIESLLYHFVS
jgi:hypothetical protein